MKYYYYTDYFSLGSHLLNKYNIITIDEQKKSYGTRIMTTDLKLCLSDLARQVHNNFKKDIVIVDGYSLLINNKKYPGAGFRLWEYTLSLEEIVNMANKNNVTLVYGVTIYDGNNTKYIEFIQNGLLESYHLTQKEKLIKNYCRLDKIFFPYTKNKFYTNTCLDEMSTREYNLYSVENNVTHKLMNYLRILNNNVPLKIVPKNNQYKKIINTTSYNKLRNHWKSVSCRVYNHIIKSK